MELKRHKAPQTLDTPALQYAALDLPFHASRPLAVRSAVRDIEVVVDDRVPGKGPKKGRGFVCPQCQQTKRARVRPSCPRCGARMRPDEADGVRF